jgi:hypothetical protein
MLQLLVAAVLVQDYYPVAEGYSWTYEAVSGEKKKEAVKKVVGKEKVGETECFVVEDSGMGGDFRKLYVSAGKDGVTVHKMRREISQSWNLLKFPMKKDEKWATQLSSPEKKDTKADLEFTVEDEEEVVVPAGTYKARRLRMLGKEDGKSEKTIELVMWFAPDVGEVKRTVKLKRGDEVKEEGVVSLLKFDKGK